LTNLLFRIALVSGWTELSDTFVFHNFAESELIVELALDT